VTKNPKTVAIVGALPDSLIKFRGPLLKRITQAGHRVIGCAAVDDNLALEKDPAGSLKRLGAEFRNVPFDRTGFSLKNDFRAFQSLKALFKELRPDVVMSYTIKPNLYATLAAHAVGVPRICALISGIAYGLEGEARTRPVGKAIIALHRYAFQFVDMAIFQNPDDRELFKDLRILRGNRPSTIVNGSGVDTEYFSVNPFPDGPITFLLVARLMKDKGVFEFVEAARAFRDKKIPSRFLMAGFLDKRPGSLTEEQLNQLCSDGTVEYLGVLDDVRPAYSQCHVYVLPSYHEGTPRTVLEAMSVGRPIVTTDARGCRETTVNDLNGYVVPVENAPALTEALMRFVNDPNLIATQGVASRKIAEVKYDVHKVNEFMMGALGLGR
jgi:glycosyltransferase involved in cell wall biosynthesis